MIFKKQFEYTQEAVEAAYKVIFNAVIKKERIFNAILLTVFGASLIIWFFKQGHVVVAVLMLALYVFAIIRNIFSDAHKQFLDENSCEGEQKYWAQTRTLTLYDDHFRVYAKYSNPDEVLTEEMLADEAYMEYHREAQEESGLLEYSFNKVRCYESPEVFVICGRTDVLQSILKNQLDESEVKQLQKYFSDKMGKRYIKVK